MYGIVVNILLFWAILIAANVPAGFIGLKFDDAGPRVWFAPPGYVIPIVWFALFALYGVARSTLDRSGHGSASVWLFALAGLCATYVYYTIGLSILTGISALWFGLIGNAVVIVITAAVTIVLYRQNPTAGLLVLPTIL